MAAFSLYSTPDLKKRADLALPVVLDKKGYTQSHTLDLVRLALGYVGVALAAVTFYLQYKWSWNEMYWYIVLCVVVHFMSQALSSAIHYLLQGNALYVGQTPQGTAIFVKTSVAKGTRYTLEASVGGNKLEPLTIEFTEVFDSLGRMVQDKWEPFVVRAVGGKVE